MKIGAAALQAQPGDSELVRWCIETYLDQSDLEAADALLHEQRPSMERRNASNIAAQLGETIAREKLALVTSQEGASAPEEEVVDWRWLTDLQPSSRR